jgi:hypothetical protein
VHIVTHMSAHVCAIVFGALYGVFSWTNCWKQENGLHVLFHVLATCIHGTGHAGSFFFVKLTW